MNVVEEIRAIVVREAASNAEYLESRIGDAITTVLGPGDGDVLEKFYRQYVIRIGGEDLVRDAEKLTWMK